jgi:hypothetical protein
MLDGRVKSIYPKEYLRLAHLDGVLETMTILKAKGLLCE